MMSGGVLEHRVPADVLAIPDDTEQMTSPEVGDTVRYEVEGKVTQVAGGQVVVRPERINGQELPAPSAPDSVEDLAGDAEGAYL